MNHFLLENFIIMLCNLASGSFELASTSVSDDSGFIHTNSSISSNSSRAGYGRNENEVSFI
jgi:hypothetical protein